MSNHTTRLAVLLKRKAVYVARLLFWAARHRSISRAQWVLDYEGTKWN